MKKTIVRTGNNTYTLEDKGDGAVLMTSTNPKYPGPTMMQIVDEIREGWIMVLRFVGTERKGRYLTTTVIREVTTVEDTEPALTQ